MSRQGLPRRACRDTRPYQKSPSAEGTSTSSSIFQSCIFQSCIFYLLSCNAPAPPNLPNSCPPTTSGATVADDIFGNDHPLEIDLGCGDGSFLIEMAQHYPERNFLGVERLLGRVRGVCKRIQELGLTNVMVLRLESQYTLEYLLSSSIRLTPAPALPRPLAQSPTPQTPSGAAGVSPHPSKTLSPSGEFLFKTDHPEYYEWVLEQVEDLIKRILRAHSTDYPGQTRSEGGFFYPKDGFPEALGGQGT